MKTEQLQRIEDSEERDDYVEVGIVKYPCYLESSLFGLTELFTVANRFARSHKDKQHSVIRVTHWQASPTNRTRIELVFDSHPEVGRSVPRILIAPPSIVEPISSEAAAPYANWLVRLQARGTIVASVCSGAFVLAEAKLLDGRTVTTHWFFADVVKERYQAVTVNADKLVIDDGDIITAGGMTAWTDLAILLIHRLLGPTVMLETAHFMLVDPSAGNRVITLWLLRRAGHDTETSNCAVRADMLCLFITSAPLYGSYPTAKGNYHASTLGRWRQCGRDNRGAICWSALFHLPMPMSLFSRTTYLIKGE